VDAIPVELRWEDDLPVLLTPRLVLRIAREDEGAKAHAYVVRNRAYMRPWEPSRAEWCFELPYWEQTVGLERDRARLGSSFRLRVLRCEDVSAYIGAVSLRDVEHGVNHSCQLGYSMDERHQGQGYMREAVAAAISFAFGELDLMRIEATYMPRNERSERLLKEFGFEREGLLRNMLMVDGKWEDHVVCSLLNPNWVGTWREDD
jgi:[ribosomal protein S5]-alanine N-acetyltransferase